MQKYYTLLGKLLFYVGSYMMIQTVLFMIIVFIYGIRFGLEHPERISNFDVNVVLNQNIHIVLIISSLLAFLLYYLYFKALKANLFKTCDFSVITIREIGLAVLIGFGFNFSLAMFNMLTSFYKLFPDHEKLIESLLGGGFTITFLTIGIIIPIFEEILFRGIIFNELRKNVPLTTAILSQGLIFGLYHMNLLQGLYGTILGILAAYAYIWVRSIWAAIFIHATFNMTSVILSRNGNELIINKYGWVFLIIGIAILSFSVFSLFKNRIRLQTNINNQNIGF